MAKEYIEREAAIERFTFKAIDRFGMEPTISASNVRAAIAAIPAADVAPVVRCGECEYSKEARVNEKGFLICPASGMEITENDYCSYGVRMGGDGE